MASLLPGDFDVGSLKLPGIGNQALLNMPWGSHVCHFYDSKDDLIDVLVPYFKQGLEKNEACIWMVADLTRSRKRRRPSGPSFEIRSSTD